MWRRLIIISFLLILESFTIALPINTENPVPGNLFRSPPLLPGDTAEDPVILTTEVATPTINLVNPTIGTSPDNDSQTAINPFPDALTVKPTRPITQDDRDNYFLYLRDRYNQEDVPDEIKANLLTPSEMQHLEYLTWELGQRVRKEQVAKLFEPISREKLLLPKEKPIIDFKKLTPEDWEWLLSPRREPETLRPAILAFKGYLDPLTPVFGSTPHSSEAGEEVDEAYANMESQQTEIPDEDIVDHPVQGPAFYGSRRNY